MSQAIGTSLRAITPVDDGSATFSEVSRRYTDFIYAAAFRQSGDAAMAADVTQAVFLVYARRGRTIRPAALPTWLHRVTIYAVKNAQRAERRRRRHERGAARERTEFIMSPDLTIDQSESIKPLLDRAIASLSARDRVVVIERYLCGREPSDIAAVIGASTSATQKRLERAVGRLRNYFQRHGILLSGAGIPWPPLHVAPMSLSHGLVTSTAGSAHSLAAKSMSHLFWSKFASITAGVAIATAVAGTAGVELSHHARADVPATESIEDPTLIAHLSRGVTLTVVGISLMQDRDRFWQANGTPAGSDNWRVPKNLQTTPRVENGAKLPQFAVVVRVAGGATVSPELCDMSFNGSLGVDQGFDPERLKPPVADEKLSGLINSFKPTDTTARMRFSVAVGDFSPPPQDPAIAGPGGTSGKAYGGQYVIGKPFLLNGVAAVSVSSTDMKDVEDRFVANVIDNGRKKGMVGHIVEGMSSGPLWQRIFVFDGLTNLQSIDKVEIRFRPREWCEFENVSLCPGVKTQVKITTDGVPVAQQAELEEVYVGGDAPRTGVYSINPQLMSINQLLIAAGVSLTPSDSISITHRNLNSTLKLTAADAKQNPGDQPLQPGDQIMVTIAPSPLAANARAAPYSDIRWVGDQPEIFVGGTWYRWLAINDIPVSAVIAAARDMDADGWQKRVGEDLVPVYRQIPEARIPAEDRGPLGTDVRLTLQPIDGGNVVVLPHVPMTEENRQGVYSRRIAAGQR